MQLNFFTKILGLNLTGAKIAATLTVAKAVLSTATKLLKPKLPLAARGYVEHAWGQWGLANAMVIAIELSPYKDTLKAQRVQQALMVESARQLQELMKLDEFMDQILNNSGLDKLLAKMDDEQPKGG